MICPFCQNQTPDDSTFCQICGARLAPKAEPLPQTLTYSQSEEKPDLNAEQSPTIKYFTMKVILNSVIPNSRLKSKMICSAAGNQEWIILPILKSL